jgi:carbamoyltransferase
MKVLGLHINGSQTAAALLDGGRVVAGVAEERLNREKQSMVFPRRAARWCLDAAGLASAEDVDAIGVSWNPTQSYSFGSSSIAGWRGIADRLANAPENIASLLPKRSLQEVTASRLGLSPDARPHVYFVDHHLSHLAMAKYQSPFTDAAVMVADEYSERNSFLFADVRGNHVRTLHTLPFPHSLGILYATFTEFLGFKPNSDEWKVMGAAAFGDPQRYAERIRELIAFEPKTMAFELDLNFFEFPNTRMPGYSSDKLDRHLRLERPQGELLPAHFDLAASVQKVFEDVLFAMLTWLHRQTGRSQLAAAGGCFMNSLANGKIVSHTPFERLFVPCAAADNGGAIGAALWVQHQILGRPHEPQEAAPTALIGPSYPDDEIESTLRRFKIDHERLDDPVPATVRELLAGRIVGWFQGAMEFGERALGARSILADPRDAAMKDRINSAVKYREAFRPFAPSIIAERASQWFQMPDGVRVPYMEQVYPFRPDKRSLVPAVVHNDGTGRLQTVERADNPLYWRLLRAFDEATGVPIVLNTSFNVQGEPIVCSPADALRTFYTSGLDTLVIGPCIVRKGGKAA